jgi:hypothetical protein
MTRATVGLQVFVALLGLGLGRPAAAEPDGARTTDVESVYFEAIVSKDDRVVARPHALTRIGADARIGFLAGMSAEPRLGLKYRVDVGPDGRLHAAIVALVNNQQVATEAVALSRDEGSDATLAGGGYTWQVSANAFTKEFLARRRAEKP